MKKTICLFLTVLLAFSLCACGKSNADNSSDNGKSGISKSDGDETLTAEKVLELSEKGKDLTLDDFSDFSCKVTESVYRNYTYTINNHTSVIITADIKTNEGLQFYLFCDGECVNLADGRNMCKKFIDEHPLVTNGLSTPEATEGSAVKETTK